MSGTAMATEMMAVVFHIFGVFGGIVVAGGLGSISNPLISC